MEGVLHNEKLPSDLHVKDHVPASFFKQFIEPIGEEHMQKFEKALAGIVRWKDENFDEYPQTETVLEHVLDMLLIVNEVEKQYPYIAEELNFNEVRLMVIMHDMGEVLRGDISLVNAVNDVAGTAKIKENQLFFALRLLRNTQNNELFSVLLKRYENRAGIKDIEAHIVKFIDALQAEIFGENSGIFAVRAEKGLGYKQTGSVPHPEYYLNLCKSVLDSLSSDEAKNDFRKLINDKLFADDALAGHYPLEDVEYMKKELGVI